jgi:hypothetical protein
MLATGVGQRLTGVFGDEPDPVTLMMGTEVSRSDNTPSRVIPHFGKVTEHHGKSSSHKQW